MKMVKHSLHVRHVMVVTATSVAAIVGCGAERAGTIEDTSSVHQAFASQDAAPPDPAPTDAGDGGGGGACNEWRWNSCNCDGIGFTYSFGWNNGDPGVCDRECPQGVVNSADRTRPLLMRVCLGRDALRRGAGPKINCAGQDVGSACSGNAFKVFKYKLDANCQIDPTVQPTSTETTCGCSDTQLVPGYLFRVQTAGPSEACGAAYTGAHCAPEPDASISE